MRKHGRTRTRRDGEWVVSARVERFHEPAVLLLLSEQRRHGYDLQEALTALLRTERPVDFGNLYRLLRALEADGLVSSEWNADVPGPAKRVYELTDEGASVLAAWAAALAGLRDDVSGFLRRYDSEERR